MLYFLVFYCTFCILVTLGGINADSQDGHYIGTSIEQIITLIVSPLFVPFMIGYLLTKDK